MRILFHKAAITIASVVIFGCASTPAPDPYKPRPLPALTETEKAQLLNLIDAIENEDWKAFNLLEQAGAPVYHKDDSGKTPYHYATQVSDSADSTSRRYMSRIFSNDLRDPFLDLKGEMSEELYVAVVVKQDALAVQSAIDHGADVNKTDALGRTALHHAVFQANLEMVNLLIDQGIDQTIRDHQYDPHQNHDGGTALCYAAQRNDFDDGLQALAKNEKVLATPCFAWPFSKQWAHTPLTIAIASRTYKPFNWRVAAGAEQALLLIDAGAPIKVNPREVYSLPIVEAADKPEVIENLLRLGADPLSRPNTGNGRLGHTAMTEAVIRGSLETVDLLVNADPRTASWSVYNSFTPMHFAVGVDQRDGQRLYGDVLEQHRSELMTKLLNAGANANARNSDRNTPLYLAIKYNNPNTAIWLLENVDGLTTSYPNADGESALSLARKQQEAGRCECNEVIRILEARG
jgi:ankyrin repeat protein